MPRRPSASMELASTSETSSSNGRSSSSVHSPQDRVISKERTADVEKVNTPTVDVVPVPEAVQLPSFPEGGLQAWLTVLGGYAVYIFFDISSTEPCSELWSHFVHSVWCSHSAFIKITTLSVSHTSYLLFMLTNP